VPKRRYGGFYGTDLNILLGGHGVGSVVPTGLHTNTCVWRTAGDAGGKISLSLETTSASKHGFATGE
jgi:nicotinamidase-related amidase